MSHLQLTSLRHHAKLVLTAAATLLCTGQVWANGPVEIDCASLSEEQLGRFYELSAQASDFATQNELGEALRITKVAMQICNNDSYTEYNLARIYQQQGRCPQALYHFERLMTRINDIRRDNKNMARSLERYYKEMQQKCGDAVNINITCENPDTKLIIINLFNEPESCPIHTKVLPGSYALQASKPQHIPFNQSLNVSDTGLDFHVPALQDANNNGHLSVRCPRKALKFSIINEAGEVSEYACPWEGKLKSGKYKLLLSGQNESEAIEIVVRKNDQLKHNFLESSRSRCSLSQLRQDSPTSPFILSVSLLVLASLALRRRGKLA